MKLTFIADTHYYSETLGNTGEAYALRAGSDQKCLAETGDIIDSAFKVIADSDTDAVFILGDLTNDGETVCHTEFRQKLAALQQHKPVYVITATHDWCNDANPRRYEGDRVYHDVKVLKSEELPAFYAAFGPERAIDRFITHIGTICYTVQIGERVRVLCLNDDKNEEMMAGFTADCWEWIERQIADAKRDNMLLIGIMHHLLMPHASRLITVGSVCVADREAVASRFADNGLRYMFVGHSHMQGVDAFTSAGGNTITEVNVASLCGYPAPMVNVTINDDNTLHYEVTRLAHFTRGGVEVDAQAFLANKACEIINRVLACRDAETFTKRLATLNMHPRHPRLLFAAVKPLLKWLDTALVGDAYRLMKVSGLARNISKQEVQPYRYKPLRELINEVFLSVFDGQLHTHEENEVYYKLVLAAFSAPAKLFGDNEDLAELVNFGKRLLTGSPFNNQCGDI